METPLPRRTHDRSSTARECSRSVGPKPWKANAERHKVSRKQLKEGWAELRTGRTLARNARDSKPNLLIWQSAVSGLIWQASLARGPKEIKEWQAIMDHLRNLPVKTKGELPTIPVDDRAAEVRAIKVS